jgi:hypothetical protein
MTKFSLTYTGIIIAVAGTMLANWGFSEGCSNEIITNVPVIIGGLIAAIGRWKAGGINVFGVKK